MRTARPWLAVMVMFAVAAPAAIADEPTGDVNEQVRRMRDEMAALRAQLEQARAEVEALRDDRADEQPAATPADEAARRRTDEQLREMAEQQQRVDEQLDRLIELQRTVDRSRAPRPVTATDDRPADRGAARVGPVYREPATDRRVDEPTVIAPDHRGAYSTYTTVRPGASSYYVREAQPVGPVGPVIFTTGTYYRSGYSYYPYDHYRRYYRGPVIYRPYAHHGYGHHYGNGLRVHINTPSVGIHYGRSYGYGGYTCP